MIQGFFPVLRKAPSHGKRHAAEPILSSAEPIAPRAANGTVGLLGDTLLETEMGPVRVQLVRPGDRLRTPGGDLATIRSVRRLTINGRTHPWAAPIRFAATAFGEGTHAGPLLVAPGQPLHIPGIGGATRFRPASEYLGESCVTRADHGSVTYFAVYCDAPTTAIAPGALVALGQAT